MTYRNLTGKTLEFRWQPHKEPYKDQLKVDGKPLELSGREISVLEVLLLRAGRVVSKEQLVEHLYSFNEEVGMNAIEVYVHRLRKKIEGAGVTIRTVRGLGYMLDKAGQHSVEL